MSNKTKQNVSQPIREIPEGEKPRVEVNVSEDGKRVDAWFAVKPSAQSNQRFQHHVIFNLDDVDHRDVIRDATRTWIIREQRNFRDMTEEAQAKVATPMPVNVADYAVKSQREVDPMKRAINAIMRATGCSEEVAKKQLQAASNDEPKSNDEAEEQPKAATA